MMEPVLFKKRDAIKLPPKDWVTTGAKGHPKNVIKTLLLYPTDLERHNLKIQQKYEEMRRKEISVERHLKEGAEIIISIPNLSKGC